MKKQLKRNKSIWISGLIIMVLILFFLIVILSQNVIRFNEKEVVMEPVIPDTHIKNSIADLDGNVIGIYNQGLYEYGFLSFEKGNIIFESDYPNSSIQEFKTIKTSEKQYTLNFFLTIKNVTSNITIPVLVKKEWL